MAWLTTPSPWSYRKPKIINGTAAGSQTDYQMKLIIHWGSGTDNSPTSADIYLNGNVNLDFSDLRFTGSDGTTLLNYWIEYYTYGVSATVWIKIPSIPPSGGNTTIYIYYGNSSQTSTSNGDNTFQFFDDFNDNSIDTSKWVRDSPDPGSIDTFERNSRIEQAGTVSWTARNTFLRSTGTFQNFALEFTHNQVSGSGSGNWEDGEGPLFFRITNYSREGSGQYNFNGTAYQLTHSRRDAYYGYASSFRIDRYTNTYPATILNRQAISLSQGTNYRIKLLVYGNSIQAYRDDSLLINMTDSTISGAGYLAIRGRLGDGGGTGTINNTFDDFRVRKYVSPEPTWTDSPVPSTATQQTYTANLTVSSTPSGAEIYLNGGDTGQTTTYIFPPLYPGLYDVLLKKAGYQDWWSGYFTLNSNDTRVVTGDLVQITCTAPMCNFAVT